MNKSEAERKSLATNEGKNGGMERGSHVLPQCKVKRGISTGFETPYFWVEGDLPAKPPSFNQVVPSLLFEGCVKFYTILSFFVPAGVLALKEGGGD